MSTVLLEMEENLAIVTLNRPEFYNSVNSEMAEELIRILGHCEREEEVRAVLLTGAGKAFCAGQDLKEVTDEKLNPGFEVLLKEHYGPIVRRIRNIEKPVVAAVNGVAAGAGANIALCCDVVVAAESASFIQAFSSIGLIPDSAGTFTLPRIIGFARASALAMLGDKVNAREAQEMGMIYKMFTDKDFLEKASAIAKKLSEMPTKGLGLTKRAFNESMSNTFEDQLKLETELQVEAANTADYQEGVTAFIEKRKPVFKGK